MPATGKGQETEEASCSVSPPVLTHGARQLVRWKANILEILSACPGVTLGEDTALGWAPAIRPAGRPTPPLDKASAAAADVWLTGLQHLLMLTVAACLGQTQESDPEEQRLGASGTRRAGSWCPRGRLPGETHPGGSSISLRHPGRRGSRQVNLPAQRWSQRGRGMLPETRRKDKHVGCGSEGKQLGLRRGEKARRGWGRAER